MWGTKDKQDFLNSVWRRTGRKPKALQEKPNLEDDGVEAYVAFQRLSSGRPYGDMGPNAIAVSEIYAYCRLMGVVDPDERELLTRFICTMDGIFIEHTLNKMRSKIPKPA